MSEKSEKLISLSQNGSLEEMKEMILTGTVDVNYEDYVGNTPLMESIANNHIEIVKYLLSVNADPEKEISRYGGNALYYAADKGKADIVKILIESGANCNSTIEILNNAAKKGYKDILDELLKAGAEPTPKEQRINSPLYWAVYFNHVEVVRTLISSGADVNYKNDCGITTLSEACDKMNSEIVKILIDSGAEYNKDNEIVKKLLKPLEEQEATIELLSNLIKQKDVTRAEYVAKSLTNLNQVNEDIWMTPLELAINLVIPELVSLLLDSGADCNFFHAATSNRNSMQSLIFFWNWKSKDKNKNDQLKIARHLIENKVNLDHQDDYLKTAFDMAREGGIIELSDLLKKDNI